MNNYERIKNMTLEELASEFIREEFELGYTWHYGCCDTWKEALQKEIEFLESNRDIGFYEEDYYYSKR